MRRLIHYVAAAHLGGSVGMGISCWLGSIGALDMPPVNIGALALVSLAMSLCSLALFQFANGPEA
jgi:hypothetical protein